MRKVIITVILLFMFYSIAYADESPTIYINGKQLATENPPVIEEGRTLVPLRSIFEALNQQINWNGSNQVITSGQIWLQLNNPVAKIGNKEIKLDVPAKLINDKTYVPLRFVAEALGKEVKFDPQNNSVEINNYISINDKIKLIISGLTRSKRFLSDNAYSERYSINNEALKIWETLDEQSKNEFNKSMIERIKSNVSSKIVYIFEFELVNEDNKFLVQYKFEDADLKIKVKEREFINNLMATKKAIDESSKISFQIADMISSIWGTSIDAGQDFNYWVRKILSDSSVQSMQRSRRDINQNLAVLIKLLADHPSKYDASYNALIDYYSTYIELSNLIDNPRGSYVTFNSTINNLHSRLDGLKAKLDLLMPLLDE
ncbi:MAG: copper amine oxidase N-terminal domain-containing protein [Bacillus sp. (in: Bacteria)]|nr:copper amine oxidase N-terminal domain-containing protein [Bacillus sp. (in: firmicutes)]